MEEAEKSEPVLATIGMCTECGLMNRVDDGRCRECVARMTPEKVARMTPEKAELIERRIRTDPEFKRKCYELLTMPLARQAFVRNYGPVE